MLGGPACVFGKSRWLDCPLPPFVCSPVTISTTHTQTHRPTQMCTRNMHVMAYTYRYTRAHTDADTHTCPPHPPTHTRSSRAGGPAWAQQEGLALAPPSALGGLQRGWELQRHPGCAGREFTSGPAAQAFISLTVVSWVALVPGPQCPPVGRMACCLPSPQGCWCFGDSLPEKPAYTGESCEVTGAVLISHQKPRRPVGAGTGGIGEGQGHPGLLSAPRPPSSPAAWCLSWARINCASAHIYWATGSPTSSPQCVPLATVAMETACNLANS